MKPSVSRAGTTEWYHVVCTTYRRRQLFKIPAAARFCERYVRDVCGVRGWLVEAVAVTADRIQLLVRVPERVPRREIAREVERAAVEAIRHAGALGRWRRRLWRPTWCAILTNRISIELLRRHIGVQSHLRSTSGAQPVEHNQ